MSRHQRSSNFATIGDKYYHPDPNQEPAEAYVQDEAGEYYRLAPPGNVFSLRREDGSLVHEDFLRRRARGMGHALIEAGVIRPCSKDTYELLLEGMSFSMHDPCPRNGRRFPTGVYARDLRRSEEVRP